MNKKLQKEILIKIKENGGQISVGTLGERMDSKILIGEKTGIDQVKYNLELLLKEGKCREKGEGLKNNSSIILTPLGEREFDPWYKKLWRFVFYDKHNLFIILALIISIISLLISIGK